ncbi:helix-turn-helix domain-containing protein [Kordiimonas aquimaris]|uniref:helix-turn-helix domain-containing protein n=1 Tax=Kordiimonas aquimaris TaxID=707591 RepID=UPI0021D171AB|nr:helix-turn-helix domain-containing protein [Kordiimonas aquimaris]
MLDISEVSKQAGIPASAIRFYEEKGLITSTGRRGLKRLFDSTILERLSLIALGQRAGFTLEEIGGMFAANGKALINRQVLSDKANSIDRTIKHLSAMRDGLRHAANCPAKNHFECPTFQRLLRIATKRRD